MSGLSLSRSLNLFLKKAAFVDRIGSENYTREIDGVPTASHSGDYITREEMKKQAADRLSKHKPFMKSGFLVLRTSNPKRPAVFYGLLGLAFGCHKHGNSPFHSSVAIKETVLEIYPQGKNQAEADKELRLGFSIDNFDTIKERRKEKPPCSHQHQRSLISVS